MSWAGGGGGDGIVQVKWWFGELGWSRLVKVCQGVEEFGVR